jgi:hypothetical protein
MTDEMKWISIWQSGKPKGFYWGHKYIKMMLSAFLSKVTECNDLRETTVTVKLVGRLEETLEATQPLHILKQGKETYM